MLLASKRKVSLKFIELCCKYNSSLAALSRQNRALEAPQTVNSEYNAKPEYPEILDLSYEQKKFRETESWHDKIKKLQTVEEKLLKINMPKYYGYPTIALKGNLFPYNCLPISQHYTRTKFEEFDKLPSEYYKKYAENLDSFVDVFKSSVKDSIEFGVHLFRRNHCKDELHPRDVDYIQGQILIDQINRVLLNCLSADFNHLNAIEIDVNPRHEAFWFVGGIDLPKLVEKSRKGIKWLKDINIPYDRPVQYIGQPYLALRHKLSLRPVLDTIAPSSPDDVSKVPLYEYDPRVIGYIREPRHGTTIPGYWPGDPYEFGTLSYQSRDYLITRDPNFGDDDMKEAIHAQGIQSSYAWLYAQACYQGFSTFHDPTYPLCTQTIITNGKTFSFYVYQLNTTEVYGGNIDNNPRVNYCWGTKEMNLFEEIDKNGKCIGFNDDVLKNLILFYVNEPTIDRSKMKQYLGETIQKIADYDDVEKRTYLEKTYKHLVSNRPRHRELPEIYAWEKLYKIDNKTRPMEAKRRFFELNINPWKRTLDQHCPEYIPKALRPDGPKSKKKWVKTHYP